MVVLYILTLAGRAMFHTAGRGESRWIRMCIKIIVCDFSLTISTAALSERYEINLNLQTDPKTRCRCTILHTHQVPGTEVDKKVSVGTRDDRKRQAYISCKKRIETSDPTT